MKARKITANITALCNLRCPHCLNRRGDQSIEERFFRRLLDQALTLQYKLVCFTGGEPFLHPDFETLIIGVESRGMLYSVMSNGFDYLSYAPLIRRHLPSLHSLSFSIDGSTEDIHDRARGSGSFRNVIKAIQCFVSDVPVHCNACLGKWNRNDIGSIVSLCESLGVTSLTFGTVLSGDPHSPYALSKPERCACYTQISKVKEQTQMIVRAASSLQSRDTVVPCAGFDPYNITITPTGAGMFCCDYLSAKQGYLGSFLRFSLQELINRKEELAAFLKAKRMENYANDRFFDGFNSCLFCQRYACTYDEMKEQIADRDRSSPSRGRPSHPTGHTGRVSGESAASERISGKQ